MTRDALTNAIIRVRLLARAGPTDHYCTGLLTGVAWDAVAKEQHPTELAAARNRYLTTPARKPIPSALDLARAALRAGVATRDLGQAVAAKFGRRVDEDDE